MRWIATQVVIIFWTVSTILLSAGWKPGNYITLILSWSLLPVMIQLAYGADILWRYRRVLVYSVLFPSIYLWFVDAIAIRSGTWTIDPAQTTRIAIGKPAHRGDAVLLYDQRVDRLWNYLDVGKGKPGASACLAQSLPWCAAPRPPERRA